jgi:hypothetical protein
MLISFLSLFLSFFHGLHYRIDFYQSISTCQWPYKLPFLTIDLWQRDPQEKKNNSEFLFCLLIDGVRFLQNCRQTYIDYIKRKMQYDIEIL